MEVRVNKTVVRVTKTFLPRAETCRDCERQFIIRPEEIAKYQSRKMELPKRCRYCRRLSVMEQKLMEIKKLIGKVASKLGVNDKPELQAELPTGAGTQE